MRHALRCASLLLLFPLQGRSQFHAVPVSVTADPVVKSAHLGAAAHTGWTAARGDAQVTLDAVAGTASVVIPLQVNLNLDRYVFRTIGEPAGCAGLRVVLYQQFLEAHENAHVAQIRDALQASLSGALKYDAGRREFEFLGSNEPVVIAASIRQQVVSLVKEIAMQDASDFTGFATGRYSKLETQARAAACGEFMREAGNPLLDVIESADAREQNAALRLPEAAAAIAQARASAEVIAAVARTLEQASRACVTEPYRKALEQFRQAAAKAEADREGARAARDVATVAVHNAHSAVNEYEMQKRARQVLVFPKGDASWEETLQRVTGLQRRLAGLEEPPLGAAIAAAEALADEAEQRFANCSKADPAGQPVKK